MSAILRTIASLAARRPRATTLAVLLTAIALLGGAIATGAKFQDDFTVPGIESQRAQDLLEERFGVLGRRRGMVGLDWTAGGAGGAGRAPSPRVARAPALALPVESERTTQPLV